jgi:peptidoglycan hydrolase CwlO-like protein
MPKLKKLFLILISLISFVFVANFVRADISSSDLVAHRAELEQELAEIESQIENLSGVVQDTQQKRTSLERDVAVLNAKSERIKLEIRAYNLQINRLSEDITHNIGVINELDLKIQKEKESISEMIRRTNEIDGNSFVEILLGYDNLSDYFVDTDSFEMIQSAIQDSLRVVRGTRENTEREKEQLQNRKEDQLKLKLVQESEKKQLAVFQAEKNKILKETKGEEEKYQKLLEEKKETAAEIRTRIFRLFGGGELPFGEAVQIAQFAEKASGIRAAFLLAVLAQESAIDGVIGRNLGQCYYNTYRNNASGSVMRNSQKPSFLAIMNDIGMDPNTTPVSCPIASDGAYGGAMGPAQFMPTTWWNIKDQTGYKRRVASVTGNNPPSPFNNADAFVAASLYLKDAYNSSACRNYAEKNKHISPKRLLQERCTASRYYAGSNWYKFRWAYGEPVVDRAAKFQEDIDTLSR